MLDRPLRIATRRSPLALWQAEDAARRLRDAHPGLAVELLPLVSAGDQLLDSPLAKIGGKGLFVKELESALFDGRADIAVHSMKDVPAVLPEGLVIGAILPRENPFDALVCAGADSLAALPAGARVGTSSLRREAQLRLARPDLQFKLLRGSVNTRLAKLDAGEYDAIVLACAGLHRLQLGTRISEQLPTEVSLPAVGQGAIGVECRADDSATAALLAPLHHGPTAEQVDAERALNHRLDGGCQVPIAAFAQREGAHFWLRALVAHPDGSACYRAELRTDAAREPAAIGVEVAELLLAQGAETLLRELGLQPGRHGRHG